MFDLGALSDERFRFTEAEASWIADLAPVKVAADSGDRKAKIRMKKLKRQMALLEKKAIRGNAKAARAVRVLTESGIMEPSLTFHMEGALSPWTWRIGNLNVTNVALIAASGLLLWKKKWKWAPVPAGVVLIHEGMQKGWW